MKLKVLDLEHWCQHTSLHIEFPDTAIVRISGPNNVGKSNLIKAIGRVLAQGRSDFGDAADIQYGAKQATLRLQAETSEGSPFTIGRVVREKQSKVSLEFDGLPAPIASAEEVETKLTEWFGRLDTLLSLFIAPQGRIASLLKTGGKQRLVDFIEICGFKSFILKQSSLNKFIKAYPIILDPSMTLADIQAKAQSAKEQASEKQAAIAALPLLAAVKAELDGLQAEKALRAQQKTDLAAKQQELQGKEQLAAKSLPDLKQLEQSTLQQQANARQHKICLQYQNLQKEQGLHEAAAAQLNAIQADTTDYAGQIQKISDSLQNDLRTKSSFEQTEQELQTKQDELRELNGKMAACNQTVQGLRYGRGWHAHSIAELQKGLTLLAQRNAHTEAIASTTKKVEELRAVPIPTPAILKACQATEEKLQELLQLQGHAKGARDSCPLCKQAWVQTAVGARIQELEEQVKEQREQVGKASDAQKVYQAWVRAQKECPAAQEQLGSRTKALELLQAQLAQQLAAWNVPAKEIDMLPTIIAEYSAVHDALNPPTAQAQASATAVEQLRELVQSRQQAKVEVGLRIETANQRMREVLVRQNKSQGIIGQRAKLQQQLDTLTANVAAIRKEITAPPPADFDPLLDYKLIVSEDEEKERSLREEFRTASSEWANRSEQVKEAAALRREVSHLEHVLDTQPWNDAKQERLDRSAGQAMVHQQLSAELSYIQNQMQQLNTQLNGLQEDKKAFDAQTKNMADLQAVSSFLSYDNGPQKFLEVFFQDTLNQTNLLISEMGLPVTLQMGNALEIMVQDNQKRVSSSLALGGGYANLIGIAFRIALQKMVLPRVNTVILDEPSTHVDEQNMEQLLIPFFERLKENLHTYGISQCIIIDHHPAWRNSSVGIINIGEEASGTVAEILSLNSNSSL